MTQAIHKEIGNENITVLSDWQTFIYHHIFTTMTTKNEPLLSSFFHSIIGTGPRASEQGWPNLFDESREMLEGTHGCIGVD